MGFFLNVFSFLILPFSFTIRAIDPTLHPGFIIWSFLSFMFGFWIVTKSGFSASFVSMAHRKIFWVWGFFFLLTTFSLIRPMNLAEGIFAWSNTVLSGSFFFLCSLFFYRYPCNMMIMSRWAMAAGFGLSILGIAGVYWNNDSALFRQFFFKGMMINKNLYASSLFLIMPFVVYSLASDHRIWRRAAAVLIPVIMTTSLLSLSRAVWLAFFLPVIPAILLSSICPLKQKGCLRETRRKLLKTLIIIFAPIVFLLAAYLSLPQSVEKTETVHLRFALWGSTVQMIRDEFLLGVGPGQWRLVLPKYGEPEKIHSVSGDIVEYHAQRPHNDFLWVASETGILGGACYVLFFGLLFFYAAKIMRKADGEQKKLILSMIYGISGYLIIAMFSYPRERPLHSLLITIMAAAVVSSYHRLYPVRLHMENLPVPVIKWIMMILLFICCLNGSLRLYSEIQLKKALKARADQDHGQVIAHIHESLWPVYSIDPFGVPLPWYRGAAYYNRNNPAAALEDFRQALRYHPYHAHSINAAVMLEKEIHLIHGLPGQ